ncbi:MAG: hypothetical protein R3D33_04360 [Hyphomicrobiaceae bacterium]
MARPTTKELDLSGLRLAIAAACLAMPLSLARAADPLQPVCIRIGKTPMALRMMVPAAARIVRRDDGTVRIDPDGGVRLLKFLNIGAFDPATLPAAGFPEVARFPNGIEVRFGTKTDGGGSGRPESHLDGMMIIDDMGTLSLSCHDQSEDRDPSARWCLDDLRGASVGPAGSGCP